MSAQEIGWVLDQATSQRRIHLTMSAPGLVLLTVEVYGQEASVVELDAEGLVLLSGLVGLALQRLAAPKEA